MKVAVGGASGTVGRHVLDTVQRRSHEVVRMSRSDGVDLSSGEGLAEALEGVDVVIDASNASTIEEHEASEFFTTVAGNLQKTGAEKGVQRIVTLSIVGIDGADFGYYRAKKAHERAATAGPVPHTIIRATQLHELPAQLIGLTRQGDEASVFDARSQTVAAAAVADALVKAAEDSPGERGPDLAGPGPAASLVDLARAFVAHRGADLEIKPDTDTMSRLETDALLPGSQACIIGPTYDEWLDSPDAAAMSV